MRQVNIALMIPSNIHLEGLSAILRRLTSVKAILTVVDANNYPEQLSRIQPSIIIMDPVQPGVDIDYLKDASFSPTKIIALLTQQLPKHIIDIFDDTISVYDPQEKIISTVENLLEKKREPERSKELSPREREVVTGIVRGLSNKEIADWMNVSVNTIMTHRRNIAAKLHIHTPAGLTIYAIVSGLVKLDDIRDDMDLSKL